MKNGLHWTLTSQSQGPNQAELKVQSWLPIGWRSLKLWKNLPKAAWASRNLTSLSEPKSSKQIIYKYIYFPMFAWTLVKKNCKIRTLKANSIVGPFKSYLVQSIQIGPDCPFINSKKIRMARNLEAYICIWEPSCVSSLSWPYLWNTK